MADNILFETAKMARMRGVSTVPVELPSKSPTVQTWKWRERRIPDEKTLYADYQGRNGNSGVATIGGKVSGNLEFLDFDIAGDFYGAYVALVESEAPGLIERLPTQQTLNAGFHLLFRCPDIITPGSQKLACKRVEVEGPGRHEYCKKCYDSKREGNRFFIYPGAIETKGEGGYIVSAPSPGYTIIHQGDRGNFYDAPAITPAEREILIRCARALDETPLENIKNGPKPAPGPGRPPARR